MPEANPLNSHGAQTDKPPDDEHERWRFLVCRECGGAIFDQPPGDEHPAWPFCSCAGEAVRVAE